MPALQRALFRTLRRGLLCLLAALPLWAPGASAEEPRVIRLRFAGDCTLGGHEGWMDYTIGTFKVMAQQQEAAYFLKYARDIFEQDDLTLVNLEGVLADSPRGRDESRKWQFRGETGYVNILTAGSVEAVTLGNNHAEDFGKTGLQSTQATLDEAGILWCKDRDAFVFEKDGIRMAFFGFWHTRFEREKAWFRDEVARLKREEGVDAVILSYHGGRQYVPRHNAQQREHLRYAVDAGADLVIGHHPHVLQGMETYNNRTIVYSVGNFCYGGNRKPRVIEYPSMVVGAELYFDGEGYAGQRLTLHPYRISGTAPRNNYQPLPALGPQAQEVMDMIQADTGFTLAPYVDGTGAVQAYLPAEGGAR